MNFFKHHLGDYAAATAHLSWDEDMAYTRLMRVYYQHEKPIPADKAQACRLARATTPVQKRAVETVLNEFFTLEDDGWHQKRCDEEIAAMQKKADQNREIGKLGGRPKKQKSEPTQNPDGFETETQTVSRNNPSQKPEATSQNPEQKQQHNHGSQWRAADDDFPVERHVQVSTLLRSLGVKPMTGSHPLAMEFAKTGATDEQLRAAVEIARQRKPEPETIAPAYLQPILADVLKPREPRRSPVAWWATNETMVAKARELGIRDANPGEYPNEFKARIQQAIDAQGRAVA